MGFCFSIPKNTFDIHTIIFPSRAYIALVMDDALEIGFSNRTVLNYRVGGGSGGSLATSGHHGGVGR